MDKYDVKKPSQLLTVQEAAEFLNVSAGTIRRWTHNKQLEGIKVGLRGDWRFTKDNLFKMVKSHHLIAQEEQETPLERMTLVNEEQNSTNHKTQHINGKIFSSELQETQQMLAPRLDWREIGESEHFVKFYENDLSLLEALSKFIGIGLGEGDFCIVVATPEHRKNLEKKLKTYGLDLIAAQVRGKYLSLDASETLSKFMVNGLPDPVRFFKLIKDILARATENGQQVRIFGEMVALLWVEGNQAGAIELEKLWNDVGKLNAFSLFCAYPMHAFDQEAHGLSFAEIGTTHARVIPAESYNDLVSSDERLRAISCLQQKAESLEAEIAKRKKLEEQKDEFISMASHELKTPVTSLTAYTQVLEKRLRKNGNIQEANYLRRMEGQLEKLTKLISDLLDVSKMQAGKMVLIKKMVSLDSLVKEIVQHVQITSQKHTVILEGSTKVKVFADRDRIGQIIINLLTNAIKYSPNAEKVHVYLTKENNKVKISVKDFGIGIAKSNQEKIFERFYQVTDPKEKTYPGLGMGLYISQQIAARHDGEINVKSDKGKGSEFSLILPVSKTKSKSR